MARQPMFSDLAVEAGLWYLIGASNMASLSVEPAKASLKKISTLAAELGIDPQMKEDLRVMLEEEAQESAQATFRFETIWAQVVLGKEHARANKETTLSSARYELLRIRSVQGRGAYSAQGVSRWPATCQTVTKRFGGSWNEALVRFKLATANRGRARGTLKFKIEDYSQAAIEFLRHCREASRSATVNYYSQWVSREKRQGRSWPSAAAQRQICGTWSAVMRAAEDALK